MRGIRDFGQGDYLVDPAWQRGYGLLARHELVFCIDPTLETMGKAPGARRRATRTSILCIDHAGYPRERTRRVLRPSGGEAMETVGGRART